MKSLPAIRPARPGEWKSALRLLLGHLELEEQERRLQRALALLVSGEIRSEGLLVAQTGIQPVAGAVLGIKLAGAAGLIWPPVCLAGPNARLLEDALLQHVSAWLQESGVRMAHVLLGAEDRALAACLPRNGFAFMTHLAYLRHALRHLPSAGSNLEFQRYEEDRRGDFAATLLRTYQGSLDCPELDGVQSATEILEAHHGQSARRQWWLALNRGAPVGVLLLAEQPEQDAWELAYMGIVPEARGQAFGEALVTKALHATRASGASQLLAAVDERNHPAFHLYKRTGFVPYDSRHVYLAIWSRDRDRPPGQ